MKNNLPLITLGIPIYNAACLVERTLLSALNQTYSNIEYLFIDDKGNSMDIVRRVVAEHPRSESVRIIDQKHNQGIGAARNAIIDNALGKYLFTMDCDDLIVPDCIEILYKVMQEQPVDFVAASFDRIDLEGKTYLGCQFSDTLICGESYPVIRYRYGQGKELFVASWNKLYNIDFLKRYNIRCQAWHFNEDPWFTYQVIINASSCRLIPNITLHYTYNPQSVSGNLASYGYSENIARQYTEIQKLKSQYICSLKNEEFYSGLMLDILKMSLYHANRVCMSSRIPVETKKQYMSDLLSRHFPYPNRWYCNKNLIKLFPFILFYSLPLSLKIRLVHFMVKINLKNIIKRWLHF